ncbi:unnamed protein product [Vicia faba]|uniref:Myb/SANT-like domain-containing protein n=1 Tax=Vicia faba TaxID=3906 RepID=A0AAV0YL39_VICFA|nr:unnamed protein product [Vicia faba]
MKNNSYHPHFAAAGSSSTRPASSSVAHASSSVAPIAAGAPTIAAQMATNVDISDSKLWPDFVTKAFIDIMVDEVTKENMPNGVFHNRIWTSMTTRLSCTTNRSFKIGQLKAKMHRLRNMYREFYSLLQNTGFGWNPETNTVTASEEVWRNYLKVHDKASQFQNKGCNHYKSLEIIFNKNNPIGILHHSST